MLTWALVLATYNRADILATCVALATDQSRPPEQVIVIDASDAWAESKAEITELLSARPGIALTYERADERSLTVQRNQGLSHARTDIVFMIDDDCLMFPESAARIMDVYELDSDSLIAGAQASVSADPPPTDAEITVDVKSSGQLKKRQGLAGRAQRRLVRTFVMLDLETTFIPYLGGYPDRPVPKSVQGLCQPTRFMSGFRMTYRTSVVTQEGFDSTLRSYCPGEDTDASYRISQHGALVTVTGALMCHYRSASGRVDRRRTSELGALNRAYFLKRNAEDLPAARRTYYRKMPRRLLSELTKDLGSRRWDIPQARGFATALRKSRRLFAVQPERLDEWYVGVQEEILGLR